MLRTRLTLALLGVLLASTVASAESVNLAWDASTDTSVTGYVVKVGTRAGSYTTGIDVGKVTSWTVNGLVADQKYYFVVVSYNASGMASSPSNEVSNDALIVKTGGTLTDQRPSVFWFNGTNGIVETWHMQGINVIDTRQVNLVSTDTHWKIAGTGDLNGDGYSDIVWRHDTQGWLAYWTLVNNTVTSTGLLSITQNSDLNWAIKGLGDVNGDGYADLIWQHTNGSIAVWTMRGATVLTTTLFSISGTGDPNWKIAAVADLNKDGKKDLIFQHATGGWLAVWFVNGTQITRINYLSINQQADTNWKIQAAGDIDGSGVPKIIWRHQTQGWVAAWTMNDFNVTGTFFVNPNRVDNMNWQVVGAR
jgi:VCBS repeat protein/fibronectin type III domain protein